MNLDKLMQGIGLVSDAQTIVKKYTFASPELNATLHHIKSDFDSFLAAKRDKHTSDYYEYMLALFVNLALVRYQDFERLGYGTDIYFDTFADIAIWNKICINETGICGLKELDWLCNHINLGIVRLGRLQFQKGTAGNKYLIQGQNVFENTEVYYVHIPQGGPLTPEACELSYNQALKVFGHKSIILMCDSWLLSPTLNLLLTPESNIIKFKNKYNILSVKPDGRSAERYLFGKICDNPEDYAPTSSLASKVKELRISGKYVGEAIGAFIHSN